MKIVPVVIGLVFNKENILLIQESKKEYREKWFLPGGKVEKNENLLNSLKREIKEEANIEVKIDSLFYFDETCINSNESYKIYRFFFVCSTDDSYEKENEDEHSMKSKWILIDEIDNYCLRDSILLELLKRYKLSKNELKIENFVEI